MTATASMTATAVPRSGSPFGLPAAWWPVAFSAEVTAKPRSVRLGKRAIVVFRTPGGDVHAVDDLCPHRRLPLSMGWVTDDGELQCGYHGWCFDGDSGRCTRIPNLRQDEHPSTRLKVAAFLTGETNHRRPIATEPADPDDPQTALALAMFGTAVADGFVFVWAGDPAQPRSSPRSSIGDEAAADRAQPLPGLRGEFIARVPHRRAAEALLLNPGRALRLGWLLGSGDEMSRPEARADNATVVVYRERLLVARGRAATFNPIIGRTVRIRIESRTDTGLTRIVTERSVSPETDVTVGLTPIGPYRTLVRWHGRVTGRPRPLAVSFLRGLDAAVRLAGRSPNALEELADESEGVSEPALDLFLDVHAEEESDDHDCR